MFKTYLHLIRWSHWGLGACHARRSHRRPWWRRRWPWRPKRLRFKLSSADIHIYHPGRWLIIDKEHRPCQIREPLPHSELFTKDMLHILPHLGNSHSHLTTAVKRLKIKEHYTACHKDIMHFCVRNIFESTKILSKFFTPCSREFWCKQLLCSRSQLYRFSPENEMNFETWSCCWIEENLRWNELVPDMINS